MRDFEVLGRQSHPRADGSDYAKSLNASSWQPLGRFTAANVKGMQARLLSMCRCCRAQMCCRGRRRGASQGPTRVVTGCSMCVTVCGGVLGSLQDEEQQYGASRGFLALAGGAGALSIRIGMNT